VTVDTDSRFVQGKELQTKCGWTPFVDWPMRGRVVRTKVRDTVVFESGRVFVRPGFGRSVDHSDALVADRVGSLAAALPR
jgi:hypothetical protein